MSYESVFPHTWGKYFAWWIIEMSFIHLTAETTSVTALKELGLTQY